MKFRGEQMAAAGCCDQLAAYSFRRSVCESNDNKPTTHQADLAKLPRGLAPLIERPQWAVWRWTQQDNGRWQKPPFMALHPQRHASTKDPDTWSDYATALAAVQAGHADGITYVLTEDDPFAAIDLDHCRTSTPHDRCLGAEFSRCGRHTYSEVTPSGAGCRIWGLTSGDQSCNRKFTLEIDGKADCCGAVPSHLQGADRSPAIGSTPSASSAISISVLDWAIVWGERRKAAAAEAAAPAQRSTASMAAGPATTSIRSNRSCVKGSGRRQSQRHVSHGRRPLPRLRLEC